MRGNEAVIEFLNEVLTAELTAINQYFIDSKMMANWGYHRLADKVRADSIDEMGDAEKLIDRILYLDGVPNLQRLGSVRVGESVPEKLALALQVETEALERLNRGIALCVDVATTAAARWRKPSSPARRSTPTGWRPSSSSFARSARPTISPSR